MRSTDPPPISPIPTMFFIIGLGGIIPTSKPITNKIKTRIQIVMVLFSRIIFKSLVIAKKGFSYKNPHV